MAFFRAVVIGLSLTAQAAAQMSLYPSVDQTLLAAALNISIGCLDALNTTVNCDATLLQMVGTVDNYLWSLDNVTTLCTDDCLTSASTWFADVNGACVDDLINVNARLIPPLTIPGRTVDGLNIACLNEDTNVLLDPGVNGSLITTTGGGNATNTTGSSDDSSASGTSNAARSVPIWQEDSWWSNVLSVRQSDPTYCLIESYSWVGSDIIRPDCSDPAAANDTQCVDPTDVPPENERIANLYTDDILCSDCFLKMFYLRVASPYLPDLDYSDYLVQQYYDIINVCNATMPDLLVRMLPSYDYAPGTFDGIPAVENTTSSMNGTDTTVTGVACNQTLTANELGNLTVPDPNANGTVYCDAISEAYNVTTGDLQLAFDAPFCVPSLNFTSVCVPAPCTLLQLPDNSTCDSVAELISTSSNNVTALQFATWNPNLIGVCNDLLAGQYACISAPGGSYVSPPASNSTTNAGTQQRGGGNGGGTATGSGGVAGGGRNATIVEAGGAAPSPTQSGIAASCTEYAQAQSGDGCYSLTSLWDITEADFYSWNAVLGPDGANCSTALFAGYYYCIAVQGSTSTTSAPSGTSPTSVATPSPVQSGIDPQCTAYAEAKSGDYCSAFASGNDITPTQLYQWNPVLGDNGQNCNTEFQANTYYCIGVPTATTTTSATTTSTSVATPSPVQSGIDPQCTRYAEALAGDYCSAFASNNNITPAQLYQWNPVLGTNGANCNTEFQANTYYCVGAPDQSPTTTTSATPTATTTTSVSAPGPTQSGIASNCNKYAEAVSGDTCYSFAQNNGITTSQLYEWNTALGSDGSNCSNDFWANEYYCVGVSS